MTDVDEDLIISVPEDVDLEQPIEYPEIADDGSPNTDPVVTFTGKDPEGQRNTWDVRGADASFFTIAGGVLKFKNPPDFEDPKDRAVEDTDTNGVDYAETTPGAVANDNMYLVLVRAIETRRSGDTGPAQTTTELVTVMVTNVDEPGVVTINWLQPEIGQAIMATLEDPDSPTDPAGVTWAWTVSNVANPDVMEDLNWRAGEGADDNSESYTPAEAMNTQDADTDRILRATVTYEDGEGADMKTARAVSAKPVQAAGGGFENGSPDFLKELESRSVRETAAVDARVGAAVGASVDTRSTKDTLTYGLRAVAENDLTQIPAGDSPITATQVGDHANAPDSFNIDKATGQITVASRLNFERGTPSDGLYVVVVEVTDPSGGTDDVVVAITASDVNEAPVLAGRAELNINEINSSDEDALEPDFDGNTDGAPRTALVNYYTVSDQDDRDGIARWDLEGEDASLFRLVQVTGRTLEFNNAPDYENPLDGDGDNVYKVTVVAYDNDSVPGKFEVSIAVGNVDEAGTVSFVDANGVAVEQPVSRNAVTAEISDPDGVVSWTVMWQWSKNQNPAAIMEDFMENPFPDNLDGFGEAGPTSPIYTPNNIVLPDAMADVAFFLRATAIYMDGAAAVTDDDVRMASATTKHAVLAVVDLHRAPVFNPDTITLEIGEGSPTETYVGAPLPTATDPDDTDEATTYELGGDEDGDIRYFELLPPYDHDGDNETPMQLLLQVRVKPIDGNNLVIPDDGVATTEDRPMIVFNHEGEDEGTNEYTVELTAIDATGDRALDATLTVNIVVTNRNEAPSEPKAAPEGLRIAGHDAPSYREDGTDVVTTYEIAGPGAGEATGTWTLTGADSSDFNIGRSDGMLTFRMTPDFENPADADQDNTYEITVNAAIAGGDPLSMDVTVTVTNVDDPGTVSLSSTAPRVGTELTASVDDPDGSVAVEAWKWASSADGSTRWADISGAANASYTPVAGDVGMFLQAMVTYTDGEGSGQTATSMASANAVAAATAATAPQTLLETYDTDSVAGVSKAEYLVALDDYFDLKIEKPTLLEVLDLYFDS